MASLFWDPKGCAVTVDTRDAGKAVGATLGITRKATQYMEWNPDTCKEEVGTETIQGMSGTLSIELLGAADVANMALALAGTESPSGTVNIGAATTNEYELSFVVKNAADCPSTWTYTFPRVRLADEQEHVFAVPSDQDGATNQTIAFEVLLAAGATSLGTIVKS